MRIAGWISMTLTVFLVGVRAAWMLPPFDVFAPSEVIQSAAGLPHQLS